MLSECGTDDILAQVEKILAICFYYYCFSRFFVEQERKMIVYILCRERYTRSLINS